MTLPFPVPTLDHRRARRTRRRRARRVQRALTRLGRALRRYADAITA